MAALPATSRHGRTSDYLRNYCTLIGSGLAAAARQRLAGPRRPTWDVGVETVVDFLRRQTRAGLRFADVAQARAYGDALIFQSEAYDQCQRQPAAGPVRGEWYIPPNAIEGRTLLYLHGGGYVHYSFGIRQLIALVATACRARTFVLDYRLAPEHPFPAAYADALAAYAWLLESGLAPARLALAGDSAGGHLALTLLQALRDQAAPLPALGVLLCPWVDLQNAGASLQTNARYDYLDREILDRWAAWYIHDHDPLDPRLAPQRAPLAGLPPLYVQTGQAEVLYDMICAFAAQAQAEGAAVRLDAWPDMVHDFQVFGPATPQSREALARIAQAVDDCLGPAE